MFDVVVMKHIGSSPDGDDYEGKQVYFNIKLPFPPYVGLSLGVDGWICGELQSVHWTGDTSGGPNYFTCRVNGERPFRSDGYEFDFEYLYNQALESGWLPYDREARKEVSKLGRKQISGE